MGPRWVESWGPTIVAVLALGYPAFVWAGNMTARLEQLEKDAVAKRQELREDLLEINRKLDRLVEQRK